MKRFIKKMTSLLLVAIMIISYAPTLPFAEKGSVAEAAGFDSDAAVAYARKYALSYNPAYYAYEGNDCANFVSQCLIAGNIPMNGTIAWGPSLYEYLKGLGYQAIINPSANQIKPGNPVFYGRYNNEGCSHTAICIGYDSAGTPIMAAHTNDRLGLSHWSMLSAYSGCCTVLINTKDYGVPDIRRPAGGGSVSYSPYPPTRVLTLNCRGGDVLWVQNILRWCMGSTISADGIYGSQTAAAVRAFQSKYGLAVDGKVGNQTKSKMLELENASKVVNPTSVSISATSMDITKGKTKGLSANIEPSNATDKSVRWSSSNTSVATVTNGTVTGVSEGTAVITASSVNGKSAACTVTVRKPLVVTFVDYDDTVLEKQTVDYGGSANAPKSPSRYGYTFTGWSGVYQNVKSDATVKANYAKNVYKVTFKETNGTVIGATQQISHGDSAKAPDESQLTIPAGYTLAGWSEDFSVIESDMTIYPVYKWADEELPVVITTPDNACTANYDEGIYYLHFTLKNHSKETKNVRVMSYMVTKDGKMVAQGETRTVSLPAASEGESGTIVEGEKEIDDMYIMCSVPADKARIVVLDDYESAVPLAEMADVEVDAAGYGKWTDTPPAAGQTDYQTKDLYRYKNVRYTTSTTSSSMAGWTRYNMTSSTKGKGDRIWYGSGRSATAPGNSNYYRCWAEAKSYSYNPGIYTVPTYNISISTYGGATYQSMVKWIQCCLCRYGYYTTIDGVFGSNTAAVVKNFQRDHGLSADGIVGTATRNAMQNLLNNDPLYDYYYESKNVTNTYYYYQIDEDWSDWQEAQVSGDTELNPGTTKTLFEKKTQYRYREYVTDSTGTLYTPDCSLPENAQGLAGKDAIVIVFKNKVSQIAEDNVEYIGTTHVDSDGSLNISFTPREELSYEGTGDYTIVLGVKGTSNYVKVGTIEAERPKHKVVFADYDGRELDVQEIEEGKNAELPETPVREGYNFIGWDTGITNIRSDIVITAQYEKKKYTVTYVDWENRSISTEEYGYGDMIRLPDTPSVPEELEFDGWSVPEGTSVTEDLLCIAKFSKKKLNVTFVDWDGNVVEKQEVEYGSSAMAPEVVENPEDLTENSVPSQVDDMDFVSWGEDIDLGYITTDLIVGAIYSYEETTGIPIPSVESGEYSKNQVVELTSDTEDAVIYYTLDGSDPTDIDNDNVKMYTEPITISVSTRLKCYATSMGRNDSTVYEAWYAINKTGNVPMHVVTIYAINPLGLETIQDYKNFVKDNTKLDVTAIMPDDFETVQLDGLYYDKDFTEKWQNSSETVTDSIVLYAKYVPKEFEVTYLDEDGSVITKGKVPYGNPVDDTVALEKKGYHFVGWESDLNTVYVTADMSVKAKYVSDAEFTIISFPRTDYSIMEGSVLKLNPKVTYLSDDSEAYGETIEWFSNDDSIAIVDQQGNVTSIAKGNAIITARIVSSGESATCRITVTGNPEETLTLYSNSDYSLKDGILREIDNDKNTVSEVKSQIDAQNLKFFDIDNIELSEDERVGTGTKVIMLDESGKIVDSAEIIIIGDYNGDGLINGRDVSGLSRALLQKEMPEQIQLLAMDLNGDGYVNNRDAAMLGRYLVGKEGL